MVGACCLAPLAWLVVALFTPATWADPGRSCCAAPATGPCAACAWPWPITPLRQALGLPALARMRRLIGLFAFFYAAIHALCYLLAATWAGNGRWPWMMCCRRPFILVVALAVLLLAAGAGLRPSPKRGLQLLGAQRWQRLHHSVHAAAWLALLHFYWMRLGKNQWAEGGGVRRHRGCAAVVAHPVTAQGVKPGLG